MVNGYSVPFNISPRLGRIAVISGYNPSAPAAVRNARESTLAVKGARLFNLMPRGLRDLNTESLDIFKTNLDTFLTEIPDQPTISGRTRAAATNSLIDQLALTTG